MPYMFIGLFRLILINYLYHPRVYVSSLFRMILISVYAGLFRLIINIIISILWHDINLFRLILYYKFVTFWHDIILLHVCQYIKH
jgi:hypothetical protein